MNKRPLVKLLLVSGLCGILLSVLGAVPVAVFGLTVGSASDAWLNMPSELKILQSPQRSDVYASDGKTLLATFYTENRHDIQLSEISPDMQHAIIAAEDSKFYIHPGYDIVGILRAFVTNSQGNQQSGASTITMQYVRQALTYYATSPAEVVKATENTPQRKLREIRYAVALEKKYTKDQILDLYLNIAYFGHGAYGIYAASQVYFNTVPKKLTPEQASLLAGLVKSPSQWDPAVKMKRKGALDRREYVLSQMVKNGYLTQEQAVKAKNAPLKFYGRMTPNGCTSTLQVDKLGAGFFCDYLRRWWISNPEFGANEFIREQKLNEGGLKIISTLDIATQKAAHKYARHQPSVVPEDQRITEKSKNAELIVAVEPGSGKVLAMGTNRNYSNDQSHNGKNTNPGRHGQKGNYPNTTVPILTGSSEVPGYQAGSVFKIFTVVAAIENGYDPNYAINAPSQFISKYPVESGPASCGGHYCTSNANPSWMDGSRNMYTGFGRSVNTYFIPLQQKVGSEKSVDAAKRMGISFSAKGTKKAPSDYEFAHDKRLAAGWGPFSLGVSAVTPLELASAYATIAANGRYCVPRPVATIIDRNGVQTNVAAKCTQAVRKSVAKKALDVARCPVGDKARYGKCDGGTAEYVHDVVRRPVAGKSGTTDQERTATFVAMTPQIAIAGMLVDTDNPLNTGHKMKHPPINYAVTYTLRDGSSNKPVRDFP